MKIMIKKDFWLAVGLLAGAIIGAGVFSLPFAFQISGLSIGFFYLFLAAAVYIAIHWMYSDIILRTEGEHRFVGYAKIYLGEKAAWFSMLMTIVEMIFVMTIYLVLSQSFGNLILASGEGIAKLLIFWFLGSVAVFASVKRIALLELLIVGGIFLIMIAIFGLGILNAENLRSLNFNYNWPAALLPLAPVLFALSGRVAIPSLVNILRNKENAKQLIWKSIAVGTIMPAILYGLFAVGILGLNPLPSEDSVSGLIGQVPNWILFIIGILGLLSLWSSYIVVGLDVKNILFFDLKFSKTAIFLMVVTAPLLLYLAGLQSFFGLVGFVGGIFLALEGIFITLMWLRAAKRKLTLPIVLLLSVFVVALAYEIIK